MDNKKKICCIIIILLITIIYFYFNKKENMTNTNKLKRKNKKEENEEENNYEDKVSTLLNLTKDYINKRISEVYLADIDSIRTLAFISKKIQTDGLNIAGNLNVQGSFNYLPTGTIVAFNNSEAPNGWALCDGTNGTPDLRGRFIYGHGSGKSFGELGGNETHTLTINEMPTHNHNGRTGKLGANGKYINDGKHSHKFRGQFANKSGKHSSSLIHNDNIPDFNSTFNNMVMQDNSAHSHFINSQGQNQPHNNMPPYCVLSYIMKL